jgi:hypothetical protein
MQQKPLLGVIKTINIVFFFLFILPIIFVFLSWKFLTCSVEGDGNVLSDIASGKACHTEGTLLQAAV